MNVRIDWKSWHAKGLGHYDRCSFVSHARQRFQRFKVLGHLTFVLIEQNVAKLRYRFGFLRRQATRPNDRLNSLHRETRH